MSDTPRADALMFIPTWKEAVVPASNYRELERELAAVKKDRDEWRENAKSLLRALRDAAAWRTAQFCLGSRSSQESIK